MDNPTSHRLENFQQFIKAGTQAIAIDAVARLDTERMETHLEVDIHLKNGQFFTARDLDALDIVMRLKPSVLEGRRMRWAKRAWIVHNLLAHPLMQLLALVGCYRWGMWVHDRTVPRPRPLIRKPR